MKTVKEFIDELRKLDQNRDICYFDLWDEVIGTPYVIRRGENYVIKGIIVGEK